MDNDKLPANLHLPPLYTRAKNVLRQNDRPVRALAAKLRKVLGDRIQPEDYPLVRRWCELEFLLSAAFTEIYNRSLVAATGEPRSPGLTLIYSRLLSEQRAIGAELGMSPKSRLAIKDRLSKLEVTEEGNGIPLEALRELMNRSQEDAIDVTPAPEGGRLLCNGKVLEDS
jgi:hypothetical protein